MFEYLAYINFKRVVSHCRVNLMNLLETFNSKKSPGKSIQKESKLNAHSLLLLPFITQMGSDIAGHAEKENAQS